MKQAKTTLLSHPHCSSRVYPIILIIFSQKSGQEFNIAAMVDGTLCSPGQSLSKRINHRLILGKIAFFNLYLHLQASNPISDGAIEFSLVGLLYPLVSISHRFLRISSLGGRPPKMGQNALRESWISCKNNPIIY